ncbi:cytidine deaminase [Erwinia sp. OLTSP20]|uniref:cytidine deaminase n=1 Tax=unclassified Erwinia TaxID=2622719 RepID=UPI000C189892|nr:MULTISPECIES: cytidine deaminase [unclassified Erwinia]PIJ50572.1 cytidine deaminase [Erwinia sp. OAMSP11]PIJ72890.1 cytidine deaminase [Erwinia sp. OLSSP12]PIJ82220.1 cytidine deaminase [Erwinia sp. OLCASP19]PIJ84773.1 cytidine deaminase [Erwinia sp. OLMTSP26]PIJ86738.1 cytidine deaminase [Erwinia sp. OLMDSP33]
MQTRFTRALASLPDSLRAAITPLVSAADFQASFSAEQVSMLCQQTQLNRQQLAFALLPLAAACAWTPISQFNVGAIAHGASGHFWLGANMEFSGTTMQQTVHAEQSAITHAWMKGESALQEVTVNYTPCGHCRQFMNELNSANQLVIQLPGRQPALLHHYLPDAFGPQDLQISRLLMDPVDHALTLQGDALTRLALQAANRSYAPYSNSWSGIALQLANGQQFSGSYAENAAFNPSLPPLQAALIMLNMAGESLLAIKRAVLVEKRDARLSQHPATAATLAALGCHHLECIHPEAG